MLAALHYIYEDGTNAEIVAADFVESEQDGEIWFCGNKADWPNEINYVLYEIVEAKEKRFEFTSDNTHTPKQIIEQCILRWSLSDDFDDGELAHWVTAAETILSEFELRG